MDRIGNAYREDCGWRLLGNDGMDKTIRKYRR